MLRLSVPSELVELNVDQCALGVGKDCGNWGGACLLNLAFHHGVVDHMGVLTIRNGYALQCGTITGFDFLDGIAGANGDAGDVPVLPWLISIVTGFSMGFFPDQHRQHH